MKLGVDGYQMINASVPCRIGACKLSYGSSASLQFTCFPDPIIMTSTTQGGLCLFHPSVQAVAMRSVVG